MLRDRDRAFAICAHVCGGACGVSVWLYRHVKISRYVVVFVFVCAFGQPEDLALDSDSESIRKVGRPRHHVLKLDERQLVVFVEVGFKQDLVDRLLHLSVV